jgi:hypothetical protein
MWDLWWTKWYWDRVFSESFGSSQSISFYQASISIYHWRKNNRPIGGHSSETQSHTINMNNINMNQIFVLAPLKQVSVFLVKSVTDSKV